MIRLLTVMNIFFLPLFLFMGLLTLHAGPSNLAPESRIDEENYFSDRWDTQLTSKDPMWGYFSGTSFDPEKGLALLENKIPFLQESLRPFVPPGASKAYDLRRHTLNWLRQYEKYFSEKDPLRALMRITGIFHDHGKYDAHTVYGKLRIDHVLSVAQLQILASSGVFPFSSSQVRLMIALIDGNPIGAYLQGFKSMDEAVREIITMRAATVYPLDYFFTQLIRFYQSDSSAYTQDSNVEKPTIHNWYEFELKNQGSRILMNKSSERLVFSPELEEKFRKLENRISDLGKTDHFRGIQRAFELSMELSA